MKKKSLLLMILLSVIMIFSLSACGGDNKAEDAVEAEEETEAKAAQDVAKDAELKFKDWAIDYETAGTYIMSEELASQEDFIAFKEKYGDGNHRGFTYEEMAKEMGVEATEALVNSNSTSLRYIWKPSDDGEIKRLSVIFKKDDAGAWISNALMTE